MKKGFTLVEVLAVIIVLGLLIVLIVPNVNKLLNSSEDALYNQQIDNIVKASKKYMIQNSNLLPEGDDVAAIYMDDLINGGVIDNDKIIDPKTKQELTGCVVINYSDSFNQYEYNYRDDCSITISFDPEGGNIETESKSVLIGKTYGELPEPTKTGYNFVGWRGKNMLNLNTTQSTPSSTTFSNATPRTFVENSYVIGLAVNNYFNLSPIRNTSINITSSSLSFITSSGYGIAFPFLGGAAESYVLSYDSSSSGGTSNPLPISSLLFYDVNGNLISFNMVGGVGHKVNMFTSPSNTYYVVADFAGNGLSPSLSFSNIQLEKGNAATSYEPYQEYSDSMIVTKGNDYTLHAIWESAS